MKQKQGHKQFPRHYKPISLHSKLFSSGDLLTCSQYWLSDMVWLYIGKSALRKFFRVILSRSTIPLVLYAGAYRHPPCVSPTCSWCSQGERKHIYFDGLTMKYLPSGQDEGVALNRSVCLSGPVNQKLHWLSNKLGRHNNSILLGDYFFSMCRR